MMILHSDSCTPCPSHPPCQQGPSQPPAPFNQPARPASAYNPLRSPAANVTRPASVAPAAAAPNEEEDTDCVVCFERERDVVLLPCGHVVLCQQCMQSHFGIEVNPPCPMCRTPIESHMLLNN